MKRRRTRLYMYSRRTRTHMCTFYALLNTLFMHSFPTLIVLLTSICATLIFLDREAAKWRPAK